MSNTSVTITTPNGSVTFEIKTTGVTANTTMSVKTPCRYGDFCYNKSCEYLHDKTHPIHGAQGGAPAPRTGAPVRTYKMSGSPECKCNYWHFCGPRCTNMCNDFARNGCPRGQNCRFEHYVEPLSYL